MKIDKNKALELLKRQLVVVDGLKSVSRKASEFDRWWEGTRTIIANLFGQESSQLTNFTLVSYSLSFFSSSTPDSQFHQAYVNGLENAAAQLEAMLMEIETFWQDEATPSVPEPMEYLLNIFERFHNVARQLRARHGKRETLYVKDEYDVQDLLHALLRLHFDDIRAEEWTPSYAGGSARMDFILNDYGIVIEVKKTRESMSAKDVGDQLLIDIMRYTAHPGMRILCCFVYDPDGLLPNPKGIERDLSKLTDGIEVKCFIRPG